MKTANGWVTFGVFVSVWTVGTAAARAQAPDPARTVDARVFQGLGSDDFAKSLKLSRTSGDGSVDLLIMADMFTVESQFRAAADLFFMDDGASPNAFWTPLTFKAEGLIKIDRPERKKVGSMVVGRNLIKSEWQATPKGGPRNFTIAAILAHELAHMLQFDRKCQLSRPQQELQADFLAGWSIRCKQRQSNERIDEADVFTSFYRKGDSDFHSVRHHGTKRDRLTAFLAGFDLVNDSIDVAYSEGQEFVKKQRPKESDFSLERHSAKLGAYYEVVGIPGPTPRFALILTRFPAETSPAGRCGLEMGDIITEIDSKPIRSQPDFDVDAPRGKSKLKAINVRTGEPGEVTVEIP